MRLALIRHGPTEWNGEGRLQGRSDIPLSASGRMSVATWSLPIGIQDWQIVSSPLSRALETASLLCVDQAVTTEPDLVEMSFGDWEGMRLEDLRATDPIGMVENEGRGLDFQPPGGESPRAVQRRLEPLLRRWAEDGQDRIAVTHKGVIRAIFAAAMEWDMLGKPPVKLRWDHAHVFDVLPAAVSCPMAGISVRPVHLNLSLQGPVL